MHNLAKYFGECLMPGRVILLIQPELQRKLVALEQRANWFDESGFFMEAQSIRGAIEDVIEILNLNCDPAYNTPKA